MATLAGVRVVDFSESLAGPYCAQILADLGADVVKVERPGGDPARAWGPPFWGESGAMFLSANRGKRSVELDLKTDVGREAARRLVRRADVLIQAFRAGVAERLGLDAATTRAERPELVHCSITAYGDAGPLRDRPGYDPILQAHAGLMSVTGPRDGEPARLGVSAVDMGTGLWAALGVVAALRDRDRTGHGATLSVSLLDTALAWGAYHLMGYLATGDVPRAHGTGLPMIAPYGAFPTANGDAVMIGAATDGLFRSACAALDVPELGDDARFATNAGRVRNRAALDAAFAAATSRHDRTRLLERLAAAGVPASPIHGMDDVARDPQVAASGALRDLGNAHIPGYRDVATPLTRDGLRAGARRAPPAPGEHGADVLREVGLGGVHRAPRARDSSEGVPMGEERVTDREGRERGRSPRTTREQSAPEPERPATPERTGAEGRPSQAEGERDDERDGESGR